MLKKWVLSSVLNTAGLAVARMSGGSEFHAAGPACEKARSPDGSQPWRHVYLPGRGLNFRNSRSLDLHQT